MSLWKRILGYFAPRTADQAMPSDDRKFRSGLPPSGRSSVEEPVTVDGQQSVFDAFFETVDPWVPINWIDWLTRVSAINPDMAEAVSNFITLGNPGHKVLVDGDDRSVEAAITELNELAQSVYKRSVGADGLINAYLAQCVRTGAVSSEDVLTPGLDAVKEVAIVPTARIRFKLVDGEYLPFQKVSTLRAGSDLLPLNTRTYAYYAWATIENSPYAVPPFLAAIEPVLTQHEMMQSIKFAIKKVGVMGMIEIALTAPPREPGESNAEWLARLDTYIRKRAEVYAENLRKSLVVHFNDEKITNTSVSGDSRGVNEIFTLNEQQYFSGLATPPALHGRTYSTTETYAGVAFNLLLRKAGIFQMIAKRRLEQTYRLHLLLRGIYVDSVTLEFEKAFSLDPLKDAQAEQVRVQTILDKKREGLISPDQAAQECGYDQAYQQDAPAQQSAKLFRFDPQKQQYIYHPPVAELSRGKKKLSLISH